MAFLLLPLMAVFVAGSVTLAFAETYEIIIPSGAASPDAPFFWSEKITGVTTGEITVSLGDSVKWSNADTAFHTITSVTSSGEEDGLFDSGFFGPGKSFIQKFDKLDNFYYYCSIHPYMAGTVYVMGDDSETVRFVDGVASEYTDDGLGFDVKYILDTSVQSTVDVDPDAKTVTFTISGDTKNDQITFVLPAELIKDPNIVWVDGNTVDFETELTSAGYSLSIPVDSDTKEIKIMGSHVIPEFGFVALAVLSVGLLSTLFLARGRLSVLNF